MRSREQILSLFDHLMRSFEHEYSDHIWPTSTEISLSITSDLPTFSELDEWCHPDLADNQLPRWVISSYSQ